MPEAIVEAREVEKYYDQPHGGRCRPSHPQLAVYSGTILVLLGPSGSGKSTLLHFARGEQVAAMPPDMVHGGVATVRVGVTDGVLD